MKKLLLLLITILVLTGCIKVVFEPYYREETKEKGLNTRYTDPSPESIPLSSQKST